MILDVVVAVVVGAVAVLVLLVTLAAWAKVLGL